MEDNFKTFIQKIVPIKDDEFKKSFEKFKKITLQKGEFFIEQNKISKQIAFINSGILRTYYINDKAEEITSCFCTENNLASSYKSFILQSPSNVAMIALEKTELLVISFNDLQGLYKESTNWQTIGRIVAEKEFIVMEQYASILNNETAKEKYLRLLKEQPEIIQKSPINYIASYLGVTRRTLSRIRKEISK
tara:strand:+ start:69 stop:644 length:576 start_codon:yes stop_codon:yes gene_type:complete